MLPSFCLLFAPVLPPPCFPSHSLSLLEKAVNGYSWFTFAASLSIYRSVVFFQLFSSRPEVSQSLIVFLIEI